MFLVVLAFSNLLPTRVLFLGSEKSVKTDIWVIAATNHSLKDDIEKDQFRADLFHRLNTITIYVEPLRNRPADLPCLIDHFIKQYASLNNGKKSRIISEGTFEKLIAYHWPGNVRELQNVLRRLLIFGDSKENVAEMLQPTYSPQLDNKTEVSEINAASSREPLSGVGLSRCRV